MNFFQELGFQDPAEVVVKQERVDDDWCIETEDIQIKLELKEEMTFEDHSIYVDEKYVSLPSYF